MNSCRMPEDPLGEMTIIMRLETINTGGDCLDLDVDIIDSVLVAAANYNGYFIYKLTSNNGVISVTTNPTHISADEMDANLGDNRAQSVIMSKKHNIAFVIDMYDHIWLYKYENGAAQYVSPNYLEEDCYGSTWLSVAIDDKQDSIGVFTLLKHNAAEEDFGDFLEYSTSLIWTNLNGVDPSSTSLDQNDPNCEYIINQGSIAEKIYFDNGLLSLAYGELGVRVFQQTEDEVCLTETGFVDLDDNELCAEHLYPDGSENAGEIDYSSCCENTACPTGIGECPWLEEGFGGVFSSAGGIIPQIYAEYDTPGEAQAIYSTDNTIFAGLTLSNGCMLAILDTDGSVISTHQFAIGHTIKGIHSDNNLLALAAGHDGILIYYWNGNDVSLMGKIETAYANNVKVAGNIIFAATEDGIEIIQIDHTH